MTSLAITVVGHDRPGIIAQAAEVLSLCGMNLEDSSMTLLRGHFAMTLICAGEADAAQVEAALQVRPAEMDWSLARTDHPDASSEEAASARLRAEMRAAGLPKDQSFTGDPSVPRYRLGAVSLAGELHAAELRQATQAAGLDDRCCT